MILRDLQSSSPAITSDGCVKSTQQLEYFTFAYQSFQIILLFVVVVVVIVVYCFFVLTYKSVYYLNYSLFCQLLNTCNILHFRVGSMLKIQTLIMQRVLSNLRPTEKNSHLNNLATAVLKRAQTYQTKATNFIKHLRMR